MGKVNNKRIYRLVHSIVIEHTPPVWEEKEQKSMLSMMKRIKRIAGSIYALTWLNSFGHSILVFSMIMNKHSQKHIDMFNKQFANRF